MEYCMWSQGEHITVVHPKGILMFNSPDPQRGIDLWEMLNAGSTFEEVRTKLSEHPDGCAFLSSEGILTQLLVRGTFFINVETPEGRQYVASENGEWLERTIFNVTGWHMGAAVENTQHQVTREYLMADSAVLRASTIFRGVQPEKARHSIGSFPAHTQKEATPVADTQLPLSEPASQPESASLPTPELGFVQEFAPPPVANPFVPAAPYKPLQPTQPVTEAPSIEERTIRSDQAHYLREQVNTAPATPPEPFAPPAPSVPTVASGTHVPAILCTQGHPNPTYAQRCRMCAGPLTNEHATIPRPPLGTLVFSTGDAIILDRDVLIGRRPTYTPEPGRPEAYVVTVPSPNQEISRNHCEIRIDGWDARVRDLGSNNGTFLLRPGEPTQRVAEGMPIVLRPGDLIDLGDTVTIRMEP